ncbi:uncharacterized protein B0P05DRAFT_530896 [Gilbertella persicaria]|uniref:NAB co-repressor domain-containing protein n=1 Tax=Rhizopus stolonifer TaxID=4846 RepID=A0A367J0W9_RHIST|nr:uncharacterized protein B0P05DRAFT_530896 [Gilbertella persicaria]KAI8087962.1 hypothetical protein B0P05DRAFT_530896 [Gilbertella persicaria]RCH83588.1 hypothetical protein CU098_007349 [Rhizopus stolonifer]
MDTLHTFLSSIQLEQYYDAFVKAGATDQDLPLLVQFNDQELVEFLSAIDMLPFHSIKFKRALRDLKTSPPQPKVSVDDTILNTTREFIVNNAVIYGKKNSRPLTSYEEAINRASLHLALENPLLISKKGDLFDLAKKKLLEEGYRYKRGCSRSKLRDNPSQNRRASSSCSEDNTLIDTQKQQLLMKRQENARRMSEMRQEKIEALQIQVEDALRCRQAAESQLANDSRRDTLTQLAMEAEIIRFEETKIKLTKEISKLKAQERKHQWYKRRKLERYSSQSTDEGFSSCSQPENDRMDHSSAFSPCSFSHSSQEYEEPHILSHHCHSSTLTSSLICCSRESDVRASSMSSYDR